MTYLCEFVIYRSNMAHSKLVKIFLILSKVFLSYLEVLYKCFVPDERKSIRGKTVLVTGAGRGIGKCLAKEFSDCGATLILWDINETEVQETADEINSRGGNAHAYKCDVTNSQNVKETAARVRDDVGDMYMVVNNAGIMLVKNTLSLSEKDIRRTFDVNVISHFFINNEFLPRMLEKNDGHIVTISSLAGKVGLSLLTDYCGSKFAAYGYAEALADELRKHYKKPGVHSSIVFPAFANTNLVHQHDNRINYKAGPEGILEPDEVAEIIVDGVLRNHREIAVPRKYSRIGLMKAIIPEKARQFMADMTGSGFFEKSKSD